MNIEFYLGLGYAVAIIIGVILDEMIRQTIKKDAEKREFHEMWIEQNKNSGRNHYKNNNNYKNNNKK